MRLRLCFFLATCVAVLALLCPGAGWAQVSRENYPARWEVKVREGTALAQIRDTYEKRRTIRLATTDLEDQSAQPFWFRAYLRDHYPDLPTNGRYQYPRVAQQILQWMLAHQDLQVPAAARARAAAVAVRSITVGSNINITNLDERNSESAVAVDPSNPQYLVASSNNITGSGRQKQFYSSDAGATWRTTELPLSAGVAFHSDPAVAFTTDGVAWAATLGINNTGTSVVVQVYKSNDHGATWTFVTTISTGTNNDKEMLVVDAQTTGPFRDNIYLAWDVPGGGIRFARSADKGVTWSSVMSLSSDRAIGVHLATGPSGELYVAWPDTNSRELRLRKSLDGGATFGSTVVIATTNTPYEVSIPAMCQRAALIYLSVGVDRSSGPRKGNVYATWTDRNGSTADPGCTGIASASNTNVYFSGSSDGGATWATPKVVHSDPPNTDQFNQWMDVDPEGGRVHVIYYDTRDDAGRLKTALYYVASDDGGSTWVDEKKIASAQTDETSAGADLGNQYGDYNGLVAYRKAAHPVWTDRRQGVPGGKEQIFTAGVGVGPGALPICLRYPKLCVLNPNLEAEAITLLCVRRPCLVVDPLPRNCLVKFSCPGCPPGGLCPPFYHLFLEGIEDGWTVNLVRPNGQQAAFQSFKTESGLVLSFRPSQDLFKEGSIGDYYLTFRLRPTGKTGVNYRIKTRLKLSDAHFVPTGRARQ